MLQYIPHVSILVALCYACYLFLLERETFYQLNRYVLLAGLMLAFSLPLWQIPAEWAIRIPISSAVTILGPVEDLASKADYSLNPPASESEQVAQTDIIATSEEATAATGFLQNLTWKKALIGIYLIGVFLFGINLLIQFFVLLFKIVRLPKIKDGRIWIVELAKDQAPFSFLNYVFINPEKYEWETYNQIIEHEKIHIRQRHTIDMVLAELLLIFQWFNPLAWRYKKAIENNLEYLTDKAMLDKGTPKEHYQINLLKVSVPQYPIGLAMNYNQSFLKKRVKMMNAKKSSVQTSWKYLLLLPLFGLAVLTLNAVQEPLNGPETGQAALQAFTESPEQDLQTQVIEEASPTVQNTPKEKVNAKSEAKSIKQKSFKGDLPVEMKGVWIAEIEGDQVCIKFDNSDRGRNNYWISHECFKRSDFSALPTQEGEFTLKRDAGTVVFTGKFDGNDGLGRYRFEASSSFPTYLKNQGISGTVKEEHLFHYFLADINQDYVSFLKRNGYDDMDTDQLRKLAIHDVDKGYIEAMAKAGYNDLDLDDLVKGRIHNVDPSYIKELQSIGFSKMEFEDLVKFSIHNVNAEDVRALANAGFKDLEPEQILKASIHNVEAAYVKELKDIGYNLNKIEDIVKFKIHNVDAELVKALQGAGYSNLSAEQVTKAAIHNVSPKYIKELRDVGYNLNSIEEIVKFKIHNVDADLVEALNQAGYKNLSAKQITSAAIHNVSPKYIQGIKAAGYTAADIDDLIKFKIHNVNVTFIESLKGLGYANMEPEQVRRAAIHNMDVSFIKGIKDLGFQNVSIDKLIELKIHNVSPDFIKRAQSKGHKDLSLEQYKKLKIHNLVN